ncbi:hypothetical protein ACFSQ7_23530 [Paenibacillus rhizoplanae]
MITPTVFLTVVMTVIGSLKVFGQIYVMTQGGPSNSTKVLVYYIWEKKRSSCSRWATLQRWHLCCSLSC